VGAIVPTRDRSSVVSAVRSALAQSYARLEVCIVDDGSTTPVGLPPDLASDPRVRLERVDRSIGPGAARNLGVERTRAPLLAFLDDDDEWLPDKLARQVEVLRRSAHDVAAVDCGWELVDGVGRTISRVTTDPNRDLRRLLLEDACIPTTAVVLRRSAFTAVGGFDARLPRMEDWDLWLRIADRYSVATVPEILVRRGTHPGRSIHELALRSRLEMLQRLTPRLAAVPIGEREKVAFRHRLDLGTNLARAGHRRRAVGVYAKAWSRRPWSPQLYSTAAYGLLIDTRLGRVARGVRHRWRK
jgi:O-antigen biosynthesis protein